MKGKSAFFIIIASIIWSFGFSQDVEQAIFVISSGENITWDSPKVPGPNNVVIEQGGTLTIKSHVYFNINTKFIVERGGYLIIDGGTLTNACSGMWEGVEVWGDPTKSQTLAYQGKVILINDGKIENAEYAIRTAKVVEEPPGEDLIDLNYSGGIVQATNSVFKNNRIAVQFYKYPQEGYTYQSTSFFGNCDFITGNYYFAENDPDYFVRLSEINNVDFNYCRFINESDNQYYGRGIYSFNSQFYLKGKCISGDPCEVWEHGEFSNLEYGIYATVSGTETFADIQHTDFISNFKGLYISGMEGTWVTSNYFKVNSASENLGYGMYLDNCNGYKVEDNLFENTGADPVGTGLVVHNSGTQYNLIYNNFFEKLEYGILAQEKNRHESGETGLEIKCNDYTHNSQDIAVTAEGEGFEMGIQESQGTDGVETTDPAANTFSYTGGGNKYSDYLNETQNNITYWYHYNQNGYNIKPIYHSKPEVNPQTNITAALTYIKEQSCPSDLEPGGGGGTGGDDGPRDRMATADQKADSTEMLLDILVDGGNTEALATDVQTSYPPEAWDLYVSLLGKSPYLSDTVMKSAVNKENVLPPEMVTDVLIANPQSAKSNEVLTEVENRVIPLTEEQKEAIMQNWYITGAKESLESKLAGYNADYSDALYDLLAQFRYDSISPNPTDSIIAVLEAENSLWAKYTLVSEYLLQCDLLQAESVLNAIPALFDFSVAEQEEYQDYQDVFNILFGLQHQGKSIYELDSLQKQTLYSVAIKEENRANAWARSIMLTADTLSYLEPVLLPTYLKASAIIPITAQKPAKENRLFVYPNPAKGYFIIRYELDNFYADVIIQLTDINGRTVKQYNTSMTRDYLVVPRQGLTHGIYFVKLLLNGRKVGVQKITIQ